MNSNAKSYATVGAIADHIRELFGWIVIGFGIANCKAMNSPMTTQNRPLTQFILTLGLVYRYIRKPQS